MKSGLKVTRSACWKPDKELTGADRACAEQYTPGDLLRYSRGCKVVGVSAGEYSIVTNTHAKQNLLTVELGAGRQVTYDPRRLQGTRTAFESGLLTSHRHPARSGGPDASRREDWRVTRDL